MHRSASIRVDTWMQLSADIPFAAVIVGRLMRSLADPTTLISGLVKYLRGQDWRWLKHVD